MKIFSTLCLFISLFSFSQTIIAQSAENYTQALELHNTGYVHMDNGNYSEALVFFNKAIAIDTTHAHYYENRGHTKNFLKDWEGAISDYEKANILEPNATYETYFQAGEILQKQLKDLDKALLMYNKAIEVQIKNDVDVLRYLIYFNRGNTYQKLNKLTEAVADYSEALKIFPEHGNSHINRGFAYYNLGKKKNSLVQTGGKL